MIWRIKKYDWSREVTCTENKSSYFPPDVVFPCRVSRHNALRCITSCYSFRYNKQLIAQFGGRHEDLSHPENSCLPRATWIFWVGQIFVSPSKLGNKCIMYHGSCLLTEYGKNQVMLEFRINKLFLFYIPGNSWSPTFRPRVTPWFRVSLNQRTATSTSRTSRTGSTSSRTRPRTGGGRWFSSTECHIVILYGAFDWPPNPCSRRYGGQRNSSAVWTG